jgi:hypothetical protein
MVAARQLNEREWIAEEIGKCAASPIYFVNEYVQILDPQVGNWFAFKLWAEQARVLHLMHTKRFIAGLKARQVGITTLALAYGLWEVLFRPIASVLMFSRRDEEAKDMLLRLKDMYYKLPTWLQARYIEIDNTHVLKLSNGSTVRAFPTSGGDSYTATTVICDESDLIPDVGALIRSAKPTVDNGGKLFLLGRPNKDKPNSTFKAIYRAAKEGRNEYTPVFLSWRARPDRDEAWIAKQRADAMATDGTLDSVHEQYPETDAEALASKTLNKRFPPAMLLGCYQELTPIPLETLPEGAPTIMGLRVFTLPEKGAQYCMGADPAEGNPTSDDSASVILNAKTGEQVAELSGKFQPSTFGAYIAILAYWYNTARVMVERNNHGHAVLLWLRDNKPGIQRAWGTDGKEGWLSNSLGKTIMYDKGAEAVKDKWTIIHSFKTYTQIGSIEGSTLRAPEGDMDDLSDAYMLALQLVGKLGVFVG